MSANSSLKTVISIRVLIPLSTQEFGIFKTIKYRMMSPQALCGKVPIKKNFFYIKNYE